MNRGSPLSEHLLTASVVKLFAKAQYGTNHNTLILFIGLLISLSSLVLLPFSFLRLLFRLLLLLQSIELTPQVFIVVHKFSVPREHPLHLVTCLLELVQKRLLFLLHANTIGFFLFQSRLFPVRSLFLEILRQL